jgi:small subunit ribosomal protein S7
MPRKGPAPRREVAPDPVFESELVTRFVNKMLLKGKRSVAERIFYTALQAVGERSKGDPLDVLERALRNVMPTLEVRPRRVGGATYQVPVEVRPGRRMALGIRWIVDAARKRPGKSMQERLAAELLEAAGGTGSSVKKREDTHKMADANKAFAHYRW